MVPVKKGMLLACALVAAFLLTELIVRFAIGFPTYGVEKKVIGIRSSDGGIQNIYLPNSAYWTVEGGNTVYRRNNLGLPGDDIHISDSAHYVFVLGSSFVEAEQVPPDSMATSVFQRLLRPTAPLDEVVNLGHSGHDAFDSYFRCAYFSRLLTPSRVILVIEDAEPIWFTRHPHPLRFALDPRFGRQVQSLLNSLEIFLRNESAWVNMVAEWLHLGAGKNGNPTAPEMPPEGGKVGPPKPLLPPDLLRCLDAFKSEYSTKFLLVSILPDSSASLALREYCTGAGIPVVESPIGSKKNVIHGSGHLTGHGNELLGELLYDAMVEVQGK